MEVSWDEKWKGQIETEGPKFLAEEGKCQEQPMKEECADIMGKETTTALAKLGFRKWKDNQERTDKLKD